MGKEVFYRGLMKFSDLMTEVQGRVWGPLLRLRGIESALTRSREERVEFFTKQLKRINEKGGIASIYAAMGGDDGDLDEFAEALIAAGIVPDPSIKISRIRIREVPQGPAPESVRRSWVGMELLAIKVPPSSEERDFITGQPGSPRESFIVLAEDAIAALGERSAEAAQWFQTNFPAESYALSFGADEVDLIGRR